MEDNQENIIKKLRCLSWIAFIVCVLFLIAYFWFDKKKFLIDNYVLIFLFAGLGFLFIPIILPLVRKIKISQFVLELRTLATRTLIGEVVKEIESENLFYIDKNKNIFSLPDTETANFLKSNKDIIPINKAKLKEYGKKNEMESAKSAKVLCSEDNGAVYFILNNKKYYISSFSPIIDMGRSKSEIKNVSDEELKKYETGR
ncbi:MAG: hypothetical protein EPN82_03000 [Bacteroidetes bacterium]|nr:MAG: hypothetical protein EPN82_03000 [Bacteroidota bacterium]